MQNEILDVWQWHSCDPLDDLMPGQSPQLRKKIILRAAATPENLARFVVAGKNNLIHRNKRSWWAFSEDGTHIEAVDDSQYLEESDLASLNDI